MCLRCFLLCDIFIKLPKMRFRFSALLTVVFVYYFDIIYMQLYFSCSQGGVGVPKKDTLLEKLMCKSIPRNFTKKELDSLMSKCGCEKYSGGRGSSIAYYHVATGRILQFDGPHPGNELYTYQVKMVRQFLQDIGEI